MGVETDLQEPFDEEKTVACDCLGGQGPYLLCLCSPLRSAHPAPPQSLGSLFLVRGQVLHLEFLNIFLTEY